MSDEHNAASSARPQIARLYAYCRQNNISQSTASDLVKAGLLRPFKIGGRTYIRLAELENLPERLQCKEAQDRLSAVRRRDPSIPISEPHRKAGLASVAARQRKRELAQKRVNAPLRRA